MYFYFLYSTTDGQAIYSPASITTIASCRWLGEGNETLQSTFDLFADQSYVYSREWLANKVP